MTREEAIKLLTQYIDYDAETPDYYKMEEACKVTIEVLEQEPCEDCISRAEAINAISHAELSFQVESELNFENYKREVQEIADGILKGQVKAISDLPSIQPKPKTGHWKKLNVDYKCSKCSFATDEEGKYFYSFCPNCGAKMESEE